MSLWQSLSQIKVRFGARENNSTCARAHSLARARVDSARSTGFRFRIFIRRAGFIVGPPFHPSPVPRRIYMCPVARISRPVWKRTPEHVLGIILSKISKGRSPCVPVSAFPSSLRAVAPSLVLSQFQRYAGRAEPFFDSLLPVNFVRITFRLCAAPRVVLRCNGK